MVSYYLVEYAYLRHALYILSLIPPTVAYAPLSGGELHVYLRHASV